jgi:hypothetical protein
MIPGGSQTPINTGNNCTSNRFRTGKNDNRQERRCNHANFNEFLEAGDVTRENAAMKKLAVQFNGATLESLRAV